MQLEDHARLRSPLQALDLFRGGFKHAGESEGLLGQLNPTYYMNICRETLTEIRVAIKSPMWETRHSCHDTAV